MFNNELKLTGYVVGDPTFVETAGKTPYAKYGLSVQKMKKGADGKYESFLVDVTCFGTEAYFAQENLTKGTKISVTGYLDYSTKADGNPRKYPQMIVEREGQSLRPKTSKIFSRNANTSLSGDIHDETPVDHSEFNNYEEDITPVDDNDMPF